MHDDPPPVNDEDPPPDPARQDLRTRLGALRQQHLDLDDAIHALSLGVSPDQLRVARLKKQKLLLRDQIAKLEDRLMPDIIA